MNRIRRPRVIGLWLALYGPAIASAQVNGIYVSEPKLFDARSLFVMLDELQWQYARVSVVDQAALTAAAERLQGQRVSDLAIGPSLVEQPVPGLTTTLTADSDTGELTPSGATETRSELVPQSPPRPDGLGAPTMSQSFGLHPQDLLSDQVNLSYRIFSLRLLLERALSDRLIGDEARQQAILGFGVNLDPPREARNKAAFVEITVVPRSADAGLDLSRMSVVALMPQEKTYNASTVSTRTGGFDGAAVAGVFSLGLNVKKSSQVFYLYRDSDTISFPSLPTPAGHGKGAVTFGWQFRPVLGRKSVAPEPRQVLAILALPQPDGGHDSDLELEAHVRTYWRKYDSKTQTTSYKPFFVQSRELGSVDAWKPARYEESLQPRVENINWSPSGTDTALVTVRGRNFFPGTKVLVGTQEITEGSGLTLKSDQTLEFAARLSTLESQSVMLSGRYGASVDLHTAMSGEGLGFNSIDIDSTADRELTTLSVVLQHRRGLDLPYSDDLHPVLHLAGQRIPEPYRVLRVECDALDLLDWSSGPRKRKCLQVDVEVPTAGLDGDVLVEARFPLLGRRWHAARPLKITPTGLRLSRIGGKDIVVFALKGWAFDEHWRVLLDQDYAPVRIGESDPKAPVRVELIEKRLLQLFIQSDILSQFARLGIRNPTGAVTFLEIPGFKLPSSKARLKPATQSAAVTKDSAVAVRYTGDKLSLVEKVLFGADELPFVVKSNEITVFLTRDVTAKAGSVDLRMRSKDGSILIARVQVTG